MIPGWPYSVIAAVEPGRTSWTLPLDAVRRPADDATEVTAAQAAEDFDREILEQPGEPGQVIAGIEDHHDARVALAPVPGIDDPGHDLADLRGGNGRLPRHWHSSRRNPANRPSL